MKEVRDLTELVLKLRHRALGLVDRRKWIHDLLLVLGHALLILVDGVEWRGDVGGHQRLHLLKCGKNRCQINAELPMRSHWQNRKSCQNEGRCLEQRRPAPGTLGLRWFVALAECRNL